MLTTCSQPAVRYCSSCELPIHPKRIQAVPGATSCVQCAETVGAQVYRLPPTKMEKLMFTKRIAYDEQTNMKRVPVVFTRGMADLVQYGI